MTFEDWLGAQLELQQESFDVDPRTLDSDARATYVLWNAYALCDEVHEALREVGWKPWSTSRHFDRDAFVEELVDALHFLGNLLLVADVGASELWERYLDKHAENARRQADGY